MNGFETLKTKIVLFHIINIDTKNKQVFFSYQGYWYLKLDIGHSFNNQVVKFTSKDSKEKLAQDFEPILDGRGIQDWKRYAENLGDLTSDDVVEGSKVVIEYTPIPYSGKKLN